MNSFLQETLGNCLTAREMADYLGCDITTVYRNYRSLGGIRIGSSYRFFEKRIIDAVLGQSKTTLDSASQIPKTEIQISSSQQKRSEKMGSKQTRRIEKRRGEGADPHGFLA